MIINFISGPRNISTAMMYSFAQRSDTKVVDEPFYAHYLVKTGLDHPARQETIASMDHDANTILSAIHQLDADYPIVFLKNMAHHHLGLKWDYLKDMKNVFLVRDPKQLIASFAQVIPNPSMQDIGLKYEAELLEYVVANGNHSPLVIDSNSILPDPKKGLSALCEQLEIPFDEAMLTWEPGPIPEDGAWASHWYANVHRSKGFSKQSTSERPLPPQCEALYHAALPHYNKLKRFIQD